MFQFESLELLYWDCWDRFRIPLDARIITITGPNGSGKTTLLDALRTLLAANTSEKRNYKKYARRPNKPHSWILSVVTNKRDAKNRPPFFPIMSEKVTLACHINRKGGDWQREYYILPGVVSIEDISNISSNDQSDPYNKPKGMKEYRIELEKAGLSHAMMTVLALEQGSTDKLCEYSPQELLKLVYAAFGDKPTLENYEKAIQDQTEAEKELEDLRGKVAKLSSQCSDLTNRVNNYNKYQSLISEGAKLRTEVTTQAGYVDLYDRIKGASANILGVRREVGQLNERVRALTEDEKKASSEDSDLKSMITSLEKELETVQKALIEENRKRSIAETQFEEIKKLREACIGVEPEPVDPLQADLNTLSSKKFSVEHAIQEVTGLIQDLNSEKMSLLSNQMRLDKPIELFHNKLTANGIAHTLLYENIEVTDEKWRVAIESILKGYRYVILLKNPSDRWKAWGMGEDDGFRHFIVPEKGKTSIQPSPKSALSVIKLSADVPEWIRRLLADIQLVEGVTEGKNLPDGTTFVTAKGFTRERRGGRSVAVSGSDFAFGEMGRKKRLEAVENQIAELAIKKNDLSQQLSEILASITGLQERIGRQEALRKYLLRKTDEEALEMNSHTALRKIESLEIDQENLSKKKREVQDEKDEVLTRLTSITVNLNKERDQLRQKKTDLSNQRQERCARYKELRKIRMSMPEHWRASAAILKYRSKFDGIKSVQRAIENNDEEIQKGEWERDGSIVTIKEKIEKDYEGEKKNLELKEEDLSVTKRVTQEARGAYIEFLRASLRFYERNINVLAELAKVDIEVVKPHLENDDRVLRETGLEVKWNFDNKGFTATDDGEGSGGQQVIKSLILLIGLLMAEGDNGGFVFIDEPFAHLDVFNIDKVAEFLMATNTQYIITSPNTHNKNVYRPAFLTLVTRKKRPDSAFAEPPGHLRRMEERNA
jgi:chromosome segregation protein